MENLRPFLHQYLFLIPVIVLFLSEMTKVIIDTHKANESLLSGKWLAHLFRPGGVPSSHSAFVTSLLIIVGTKRGLDSVEFAMSFVFASVIWYDAMSVRRAVGLQAEALNKLQTWKIFTERLGHSFLEVIAGIIFGACVTMLGIWLS